MIAINPNQRFECTIDDATFILRPPTRHEQQSLTRAVTKAQHSTIKSANVDDISPAQLSEAFSFAESVAAFGESLIVGWSGITNSDGVAIQATLRPDGARLTQECVDMLHVDTLIRVGSWAMANLLKPSRESVGKSSPPLA